MMERKTFYHQGVRLYEEYLDDQGKRIVRFFNPSRLIFVLPKDKKHKQFIDLIVKNIMY